MVSIDVVNYANKIFMSIGEPFLSSDEKGEFANSLTIDDKKHIFETLFKILQDRDVPQGVFNRLKAKAELEYVNLPNAETSKKEYNSNILLGFGVH